MRMSLTMMGCVGWCEWEENELFVFLPFRLFSTVDVLKQADGETVI